MPINPTLRGVLDWLAFNQGAVPWGNNPVENPKRYANAVINNPNSAGYNAVSRFMNERPEEYVRTQRGQNLFDLINNDNQARSLAEDWYGTAGDVWFGDMGFDNFLSRIIGRRPDSIAAQQLRNWFAMNGMYPFDAGGAGVGDPRSFVSNPFEEGTDLYNRWEPPTPSVAGRRRPSGDRDSADFNRSGQIPTGRTSTANKSAGRMPADEGPPNMNSPGMPSPPIPANPAGPQFTAAPPLQPSPSQSAPGLGQLPSSLPPQLQGWFNSLINSGVFGNSSGMIGGNSGAAGVGGTSRRPNQVRSSSGFSYNPFMV